MKSLKIWSLVMLFAMAFVGCDNDNDTDMGGETPTPIQTDIVGKWHLTSYCGATPEFDVYIEFTSKGKFNIYQQTWSFMYEHFSGTYTVEDGVLNGSYSDGSAWLASYKFEVANSKLTLKNKKNLRELSIYDACVIPEEIIQEATTTTRAEGAVPFL